MRISRRAMLGGTMALGATTFAGRGRWVRAQGAGYTVRDLGGLADEIERGPIPFQGAFNDINDNGEVGGALVTSEVKVSPAIWPVEGRRVLQKSGKFGGEVRALTTSGLAVGHTFDDVLGIEEGQFFPTRYRPAAWQDGASGDLAVPAGMDAATLIGTAYDVNEDGQILGECRDAASGLQPVIWRDGAIETMLDLPEVGTSFATRINASGLVGGTAERLLELSDGSMMFRFFPALWTNGALEMLELPEGLALPEAPDDPMPNVTVHGLSDDGLLLARIAMTSSTGESASPPGTYVYDRGAWTALPSPSDDHPVVFAYGISPTGIVVGYVTTAEFEETRHVVWTDGSPRDVTDSITGLGDVRLGSLRAVNSSGQILATGSSDAGFHGLVLTPE